MTVATQSYATLLRNAIAAIGDASGSMQSACGRSSGTVLLGHSISDANLPGTALVVQGDQRIGGLGDRRRATVSLMAFADDNPSSGTYGQTIAESIIALWRDLLSPSALQAHGLVYVLVSASDDIGDAFDERDIPTQLGRAQLSCSIAATVPSV